MASERLQRPKKAKNFENSQKVCQNWTFELNLLQKYLTDFAQTGLKRKLRPCEFQKWSCFCFCVKFRPKRTKKGQKIFQDFKQVLSCQVWRPLEARPLRLQSLALARWKAYVLGFNRYFMSWGHSGLRLASRGLKRLKWLDVKKSEMIYCVVYIEVYPVFGPEKSLCSKNMVRAIEKPL